VANKPDEQGYGVRLVDAVLLHSSKEELEKSTDQCKDIGLCSVLFLVSKETSSSATTIRHKYGQ
jgi:hypothetical protein